MINNTLKGAAINLISYTYLDGSCLGVRKSEGEKETQFAWQRSDRKQKNVDVLRLKTTL